MRPSFCILLLIAFTGCQQQATQKQACMPAFTPSAAALVFTPAYAVPAEQLDLSREGREVAAVGGIESTVFETTFVYQDDRQRHDQWGDWSRFERRAVSTSLKVRQR